MRPRGSQKELERRRRRAIALAKKGLGPARIARRLWTTPRTVCRWLKSRREGGIQALAARPAPGRPAKLAPAQRRVLASCLLKGATAFGFADDHWTCPQIARLIKRRFGARYHPDSIPRLLAAFSISPRRD
jgi:transposase